MDEFRYTDEQWLRISENYDSCLDSRRDLEMIADSFIDGGSTAEVRAAWLKHEKDATRIDRAIGNLLEAIECAGLTMFDDLADRLRKDQIAAREFALQANKNRPKDKSDPGWNWYMQAMLRRWHIWAGKPPTVRRAVDGDAAASGPAVDFLLAAAGPVKEAWPVPNPKPMTREMAAHAIRLYKARQYKAPRSVPRRAAG